MSSPKQTIAFFGATGGVAGSSLALALKAGHHCTALARTPSKLHTFLLTSHNLPASTLSTHLTIHAGDAKSASDVARALVSPLNANVLVDTIYTSIGAYPTFQLSLLQPFVLTDPHVCESGIAAIYAAISALAERGVSTTQDGRKPLLVAISSTGVAGRTRDVPWPIVPLYHYLGSSPHADKRAMEELVRGDRGEHVRGFVVVRPSLLTDGRPRELESVRAGWEWGVDVDGVQGNGGEKEPGPQVGWYVARKDVGEWVFRKAVVEGGWERRCVSLTY